MTKRTKRKEGGREEGRGRGGGIDEKLAASQRSYSLEAKELGGRGRRGDERVKRNGKDGDEDVGREGDDGGRRELRTPRT